MRLNTLRNPEIRRAAFWLALSSGAFAFFVTFALATKQAAPTNLAQKPNSPNPAASAAASALDEPDTSDVPRLIIPVAGIPASALRDTYADARSAGRSHNAIDIMAAAETPVLAAAAGEIARLFYSELGGTTLYQFSADKKFVFYYAHLARYAEDLRVGQKVRQGDVLAYVGDTGNAGAGNFHLHFALWRVTEPRRYWDGQNLNPYPLLKAAASSTKSPATKP